MEEIKNCPFCNGVASPWWSCKGLGDNRAWAYIQCDTCKCKSRSEVISYYRKPAEVFETYQFKTLIDLWNNRYKEET